MYNKSNTDSKLLFSNCLFFLLLKYESIFKTNVNRKYFFSLNMRVHIHMILIWKSLSICPKKKNKKKKQKKKNKKEKKN